MRIHLIYVGKGNCIAVTINILQEREIAMKKTQLIFALLLLFAIITHSATFSAEPCYIIDNFNYARSQGSIIYSNSRTWSSYGGLHIELKGKSIIAKGSDLKVWSGFVTEPGSNGQNGAPINIGECTKISVDISGGASSVKLEIYDKDYKAYELWMDMFQPDKTFDLPTKILTDGVISKILIGCGPGDVNLKLNNIVLKY